jgi:hypothetical protein
LVLLLDVEDEQEQIEDGTDGSEARCDDVGEYIDQHNDSGGAVSGRDPSGAVRQYEEAVADEPPSEPDPAIDRLVESMSRMRAGPHDDRDDGSGGVDERGVPVDYTAGSGALNGVENMSSQHFERVSRSRV